MTVQLYEGCWGVTRGGEKRGPMPEKCLMPFCYPFFLGVGWGEDGRRGPNEDPQDIIAVFATEAEADAYLAGKTTEARVRARAEKAPESDALARMGVNGATWAAEFREMALRLGYSAMDEGWLIGWFANAIEAGRNHSDFRAPPAPKPVTWPDGVTKMTIGPHQITIDAETGVIQVVWHGSVGSTPAQARQLAALLLAAADKVEGLG